MRSELMAERLLSRARAGDELAFRELTDPFRRELQLDCYRILGSLQDAEETLQETLLAAWRGLDGFHGRASLRTWLYRIASHRCLNLLRQQSATTRRGSARRSRTSRLRWRGPRNSPAVER
jgi:RNA polymerase sigma factor (sigma-70 family)